MPIVKAEAMDYYGSSIQVTLAALKMSAQPTASLGGFEITSPVGLRLKSVWKPVNVSGQPLVAAEEDAESEAKEQKDENM